MGDPRRRTLIFPLPPHPQKPSATTLTSLRASFGLRISYVFGIPPPGSTGVTLAAAGHVSSIVLSAADVAFFRLLSAAAPPDGIVVRLNYT